MLLNGDTLYMKVVDFNGIYNFMVLSFLIWGRYNTQKN
jgi:hypothetical protein